MIVRRSKGCGDRHESSAPDCSASAALHRISGFRRLDFTGGGVGKPAYWGLAFGGRFQDLGAYYTTLLRAEVEVGIACLTQFVPEETCLNGLSKASKF